MTTNDDTHDEIDKMDELNEMGESNLTELAEAGDGGAVGGVRDTVGQCGPPPLRWHSSVVAVPTAVVMGRLLVAAGYHGVSVIDGAKNAANISAACARVL